MTLRLRLSPDYLARLEAAAEPWLWRFLLACSVGLFAVLVRMILKYG